MTLAPGTIAEITVPYADGPDGLGASQKLRPVLVITAPDPLGDLVVLPITGSAHLPDTHTLHPKDLAAGSMKKPSHVRVRKPLTANVKLTGRQFGRLTPESLTRLTQAMCAALGCCQPPA